MSSNQKKKIILISDHALSTSGVGCQSRFLMHGLTQTGKYTFRQLGAAVKHQSYDVVKITDDIIIKPIDGFGNQDMIRQLLYQERPDAIMLFTDPRFFPHIFAMHDEIHQVCPIIYNHLWDDSGSFPPTFNRVIYDICDLVNCINWPTYAYSQSIIPEKTNYIPHAVPLDLYKKLPDNERMSWRVKLLGKERKDHFVVMFVGRNARRKRPSDIMHAWKLFLNDLKEKHGHTNATLVMHCNPHDPEGPNLIHVLEMLKLHDSLVFSADMVDFAQMNGIYNAVDVVVNASCFAGDTRVITSEGYKQIRDIIPGEKVLTHEGRLRTVIRTIKNPPPGGALRIRTTGANPVIVTHEHKIMAIKKSELPKKYLINENLQDFVHRSKMMSVSELQEGDYVSMKFEEREIQSKTYDLVEIAKKLDKDIHTIDIKNDRVCRRYEIDERIHEFSKIILNEDLAYILGEFVGDGSTNSTSVSFNSNDQQKINLYCEKFERVFGIKTIQRKVKDKNCINVWPHRALLLQEFFQSLCGLYSSGKQVPEDIMNSNDSIKRAFLDGLIAADGYYMSHEGYGTTPTWRIRTISHKLACQLRELISSLGMPPRMTHGSNAQGYNKNGMIWTIEWNDIVNNGQKFNGSSRSWVHDGILVSRIQKIEKIEFNEPVYDLTVEEDHSYVVENINVHNCNEGFGLPILEAKMAELPCIVPMTGGLTRQIKDHETGFEYGVAMPPDLVTIVGNQNVPWIAEDFVSNQSIASAFMKMHELSPDERKNIGQLARKHVEKHYDMGDVIRKWDESLTKLFNTWTPETRRQIWSTEI